MSLDVLAQNLASRGRNGDTMLVHMTPGEVHGLHALALAHGGQLTINPETGLPEANFLKKLLPMIAGAALNFFAPGIGTAIGSALGGLSGAAGSAIAVGGITGLATGSLQKGLMAGLGAYGGAGLAEGLSALGTQEAASKLAEQGIAAGAQENARDALLARAAEQTAIPTGFEAAKAGLSAAAKDPSSLITALGGGKQALQYAGMAAAPIMADQGVQTTTPMPTTPSYIRPFVYDAATFGQGPQGMQALPPVDASTISYGPPPGGANGGLVALAGGGWTGDIPGIGDPRRKEFEQYMASQLSPQDYAAQQANPYSALSGNLQASLAGSAASQGEMRRQGVAPVTPGSFQEGAVESAIDYLNNINSQRLMGGHLTKDFDWKPLVDEYMASALSGNVSRAAAASARLNTIGINPNDQAVKTYINFMDPDFENKQFSNAKPGDLNVVSQLRSAFEAGNSGWATVAQHIKAGTLTPEDAAFGLGVDVNTVKQNTDPSYKTAAPAAPAAAAEPTSAPVTQDDMITQMRDRGMNVIDARGGTGTAPAAPETTGIGALIPGTTAGTTSVPGTQTGGGVETSRTPTFMLPPGEQVFKTPVGTITGGTVTGAIDTKEALREYERTAPTGKPPAITSTGTFDGLKGADKTYGGVEKPYAFPTQAQLGTAGSVNRGTETMADVRRLVDNRYATTAPTFEPITSGASKSAYDYLVGRGAYPTNQTMPGGAPLWRPYVQGVTGAPAPSAFVPATGAPAAQFGFKPITGGTTLTGTQRWVNTKTGEKYLAPRGYEPPSGDWVLEETASSSPSTDGGGEGIGGLGSPSSDGFGPGEAAKAGGLMKLAMGGTAGGQYNLGSYSDGGRLLRGPGDGVSDSIPATIGRGQPARLADGEFVIPARIVSELGNGSTEAGARKLYAMMDRVQRARRKTTGKNRVAANTKADRLLPA